MSWYTILAKQEGRPTRAVPRVFFINTAAPYHSQ